MNRIYTITFCVMLLPYLSFGQRVGIGISSPQAKFHIAEGKSGGAPHEFTILAVESEKHTYINLLSPSNQETGILFGNPNNSASGAILFNFAENPEGFQFRTGGNFTRMTITNSGLVGINSYSPQATLDVGGNIRANSISLSVGGNNGDFLVKQDASGQVTHRKGYVGVGLNYIIAFEGSFAGSNPPQQTGSPYIGEIKLYAGTYAPAGWMFCHGQVLPLVQYINLFAVLGTTYGGNGVNTFALPDLRGAVPVGGSTGGSWEIGERSN
jgi:hypothetical protein